MLRVFRNSKMRTEVGRVERNWSEFSDTGLRKERWSFKDTKTEFS